MKVVTSTTVRLPASLAMWRPVQAGKRRNTRVFTKVNSARPPRRATSLRRMPFRGPSPRGGVRVDLSDASHTLPTGGGGVWGLVRTDPHWRRHGLRYLFTLRALSCSHPKSAPGSMADGHSERAEILPGAPASTHESDGSLVLTERCGCGRRHRRQGARSSRLIGARRDRRQ